MPYSGEASFSPKPLAEVQHFVVMTPKGMTFCRQGPTAVPVDARQLGRRNYGGYQCQAR